MTKRIVPSGQIIKMLQSGYRRIWREKQNKTKGEQQVDSTSYTNPKSPIWKVLWKVLVKHKLKVFVWKCLSEGLPVNELIWRRTHKGDPYYKGCGGRMETVEHIFFECDRAKEIWKLAPIQ